MIHRQISLPLHIRNEQGFSQEDTSDFSQIMAQIALAGKLIGRELRQAGLSGSRGSTGNTNVQGEEVQKLDDRANAIFVNVFEGNEIVRAVVSEEMEKPHLIRHPHRVGSYAVYLDPLDGSSNIDVNAPLGSIFSIHRLGLSASAEIEEDLLRSGKDQVAGGYVLYGTSTELVYTRGQGVHQFSLDPEIGEFFLAVENIKMKSYGKIYSVNEGNYQKWPAGAQQYVDYVKAVDSATDRPYAARYSGCLVADVHRILLKGGLYLYPGEVKKPDGKLRLMYEAAPLTFVMEQAGGAGSTGVESINTILPTMLHQRVPLWIGSRENLKQAEQFLQS